MGPGSRAQLLLVVIFGVAAASWVVEAQPAAVFSCHTAGQTCRSLVDYLSANKTTLDHIQKLFNLKHVLDIVGANAWPSNTRGNRTVKDGETVKIPFECNCTGGIGLSNKLPVYNIKKDDTLSHIADEVFSRLVTYQKIAEVNNIPDPNKILVGQKVWIPLPCSCDQLNGTDVVHYGHRVAPQSSFEQIARQYGTTQDTLLKLNNITDPKSLQAGQIIDVPLKACSSSAMRNDSSDYPLLVASGTDTYTANNCVKCSCNSTNNVTLQCEPSQVKPNKWPTCPSMLCGNSTLGNITSTASCTRTICAYAGYDAQNIFTAPANESTCPATTGSGESGGSSASRISFQGWGWNHLLIAFHFIFFCVYLL